MNQSTLNHIYAPAVVTFTSGITRAIKLFFNTMNIYKKTTLDHMLWEDVQWGLPEGLQCGYVAMTFCPHLMLIFRFVKEVLLWLNYLCIDYIWNSDFNLAVWDWLDLRLINIQWKKKWVVYSNSLSTTEKLISWFIKLLIFLKQSFLLWDAFSANFFAELKHFVDWLRTCSSKSTPFSYSEWIGSKGFQNGHINNK